MATPTLKNDIPRHEDVPSLLYSPRLPDENREEYELRRKSNKEDLQDYLKGRFEERKMPSLRPLRRLYQGKTNHTPSGMRNDTYRYIRTVLGLDDVSISVMYHLGRNNKDLGGSSRFYTDFTMTKIMQKERQLEDDEG